MLIKHGENRNCIVPVDNHHSVYLFARLFSQAIREEYCWWWPPVADPEKPSTAPNTSHSQFLPYENNTRKW